MLLGIAIGFALAAVPAALFAAWHCKKLPSQATGPLFTRLARFKGGR